MKRPSLLMIPWDCLLIIVSYLRMMQRKSSFMSAVERPKIKQTNKQKDKQTNKQTNKQALRQTLRQTKRQTNEEMARNKRKKQSSVKMSK